MRRHFRCLEPERKIRDGVGDRHREVAVIRQKSTVFRGELPAPDCIAWAFRQILAHKAAVERVANRAQ